MKKIISIIILIIILFLAFQFFHNKKENYPETKVYISNNLIIYDGDLTPEANEMVKKLYNKNIIGLGLNCPGGEINLGMDLGEWVYNNSLDIYIKNYAFSSAANYVFPAGKNIFLYKNSMVGWHGGATQKNSNLSDIILEKIFMRNYIKKAKIREKKYFEKIHIKQEITTYGQKSQFQKFEKDYVGWTYSLNMMKYFGIKNIILVDNIWNPPMEFHGKKIFSIDSLDSCD
ncbi:hypothetical protein [Cetobacterium ceti]